MLRKCVCGLQSSYTMFTFNSANRNFQLLYLVRKFQQYHQLVLVTTNLALSLDRENTVKIMWVFSAFFFQLRSALDKTEELEVSNGHLVKRLEKMKANRSALLSQQ